jgi:HEAT repeat protein
MGFFDRFRQSSHVPAQKKEIHELIDDLREDTEKEVRNSAAAELVAKGEPAVYPLIGALNDSDWRVREESAKALGRIGNKKAVKHLIQLFKDEKTRVQLWATDAIIAMGPGSVEPLIDALDDRDRRIRMGAIVALGELRNPEALPHLNRLLADGDENIRDAAKEAIDTIGPSPPDA